MTEEELKALELHQLIDMRADQTSDYMKYLKTKGICSQTKALRDTILAITAAIEIKSDLEKKASTQTKQLKDIT